MEFWEKIINKPVFYTVQNVTDTAEYVKNAGSEYEDTYINALRWVVGVLLKGKNENVPAIGADEWRAARAAADNYHDTALKNKDIYGTVRWRYVLTALNDCQKAVMKGA